jgi:hypothetical protein
MHLYKFHDMFVSPQQNNAIEHDRGTRSSKTHEHVTEQNRRMDRNFTIERGVTTNLKFLESWTEAVGWQQLMKTSVLRSGPVRFFDFQMGQPQPQSV